MGCCCSDESGNLPFLDFDNCRPSSEETVLYNSIERILSHSNEVMRALEEYRGCQELARKAMASPSVENEQEAFEGLLVAVNSIAIFYHYAKDMERLLPELFEALATGPPERVAATFQEKQALVKLLGEVFDFTLRFDSLRMLRPSISNDFSYYRRLLPKFSRHPNIQVKDDDASGMALFTAEHIPFMSALSKATSSLADRAPAVVHVLSVLANCCAKAIRARTYASSPATNRFAARTMAGAIILYDHVEHLGVFHSKSPISIKSCVLLLKRDFNDEFGSGLMNAIHYSTRHFKDASPAIQSLFD